MIQAKEQQSYGPFPLSCSGSWHMLSELNRKTSQEWSHYLGCSGKETSLSYIVSSKPGLHSGTLYQTAPKQTSDITLVIII